MLVAWSSLKNGSYVRMNKRYINTDGSAVCPGAYQYFRRIKTRIGFVAKYVCTHKEFDFGLKAAHSVLAWEKRHAAQSGLKDKQNKSLNNKLSDAKIYNEQYLQRIMELSVLISQEPVPIYYWFLIPIWK